MDAHIRDLRYFVAVAEELSFTKAAGERLFISQPALSKQIRQLERTLRVRLFDRDRRTVALTAAGAELLPRARRLIAGWEEAEHAVTAAARDTTLTVGVPDPHRPRPDPRRHRRDGGAAAGLEAVLPAGVVAGSDRGPGPPRGRRGDRVAARAGRHPVVAGRRRGGPLGGATGRPPAGRTRHDPVRRPGRRALRRPACGSGPRVLAGQRPTQDAGAGGHRGGAGRGG